MTQKSMVQSACENRPSNLQADFSRLGEQVVTAERCGADRVDAEVMAKSGCIPEPAAIRRKQLQ
jgi:hypothetical protein